MVTEFNNGIPYFPKVASDLMSLQAKLEGFEWKYEPPSSETIKKYQNIDYPEWEEKIKTYFKNIHSSLEVANNVFELIFKIDNQGNAPAENMVVKISTVGGLLLSTREMIEKSHSINDLELPEPPLHPEGKWVKTNIRLSMKDLFQSMQTKVPDLSDDWLPRYLSNNHDSHTSKDRYSFYWKSGEPSNLNDTWEFICDEFRHKIESEPFDVSVIPQDNITNIEGAIICLVTARNLPDPVKKIVPVSIKRVECDTVATIKKMIHYVTLKKL
jgi:hypothetical protein